MNNERSAKTEIAAAFAADRAGNVEAANAHWTAGIGLLELDMKRTGSAEHLTPTPKKAAEL